MKILETLKFIGRIRSNKNRQRGFTLIELVVVLAVLGVLAAIGIPQLTGLQDQAEKSGVVTNIASEVGNGFARDLAAGLDADDDDNFVGAITGVTWNGDAADVCDSVNTNEAVISDALSNSDYDLSSTEVSDGDPTLSVPSYDAEGTGQVTCFVVDE